MGKDYYDILGVSKDADEAELKKGIESSHVPELQPFAERDATIADNLLGLLQRIKSWR